MIAVRGRIQREGEVVHLVVQRVTDLSADLAKIGRRDLQPDAFNAQATAPDHIKVRPRDFR